MGEWQPIETAPISGRFLIYGKTNNSVDGPDYARPEKWGDEREYICSASYEDASSPVGRSFLTTEQDGWGESQLKCWATSWMPLPAPPYSELKSSQD